MDILIKGMEMPKSCHECPLLYVTSICDGSRDCPLVPVPPHGRLIDGDEFYPIIDENINPCAGCPDFETPHGCKSNGGCYSSTNKEVKILYLKVADKRKKVRKNEDYKNGYEDGYHDGYRVGVDEGEKIGYQKGYLEAVDDMKKFVLNK